MLPIDSAVGVDNIWIYPGPTALNLKFPFETSVKILSLYSLTKAADKALSPEILLFISFVSEIFKEASATEL